MRYFIHEGPAGVTSDFQSEVPMEGTSIQSTLADPAIVEAGAEIPLGFVVDTPYGPTDKIAYPGGYVQDDGNYWVLEPYQVAINNLLRLRKALRVSRPEEADVWYKRFQKSVDAFYAALSRLLSGKKGLMARHLIGARTGNSLRAVAIAGVSRGPEWVGVPQKSMNIIGALDGQLFLAARFPVLHKGSVEVLRAYGVDCDCVVVHPVLHRQFGLDHDGDTMSLWKVPEQLRHEAEDHVLGFYRGYDEKVKPYPVGVTNGESWETDADIDEIHEELVAKLAPSGRSIGPGDLISGDVEWYEESTGKDLIADTQQIVSGIDLAEVRDRVCNVNFANLVTKRYIGPAGSLGASIKTLALATGDLDIQGSAMYVTERLCQSLMDAKHNIGHTDKGEFQTLMDLLHFRGGAFTMSERNYLAALEGCGLSAERSRPIAALLIGLRDEVESEFDAGAGAFFDNRHAVLAAALDSDVDADFLTDSLCKLLNSHSDTAPDPITKSLYSIME